MFAYIKGELVIATPIHVVLETHGVGYKIFIPANVFPRLPQLGQILTLHVSCVIRESSQSLHGFLSIQERDLFEMLQGVSGIGPKLASCIIGHLSLDELRHAINEGDTKKICKVPGIGKKTAERMIIELRDKLPVQFPHDPSTLAIPIADSQMQKINDAMSALINLGYNQMTAQKAIKKSLSDLPESIDLATLITHSLKHV